MSRSKNDSPARKVDESSRFALRKAGLFFGLGDSVLNGVFAKFRFLKLSQSSLADHISLMFISSLLLHLHILYFIIMLMSNSRTNIWEVVQMAWRCLVSHFLRFLPAGYHPSCLHAHLPILTHLMTSCMLRTSSLRILFRRMLPVMHLKVLISIVLSRRLFQWLIIKFYVSLACSLSCVYFCWR